MVFIKQNITQTTEEDSNIPLEPIFNILVTQWEKANTQNIKLGKNWRQVLFDLDLAYKLSNKNFRAKIK